MQSAEVLAAACQTPAMTVDKFQLHPPPQPRPLCRMAWCPALSPMGG